MAAPDYDNIVSGPAQALFDDEEVGHTQGGITSTITPQNRARNVDQFGVGECAIIHTGDEVRCTIPFAELTADVLANIYAPGADETGGSDPKYVGIGRSAGFIYPDKDLKIIPLLTADAAKRLQFWRATPIGDFEQIFNGGEDDRIFEVEYACLLDESQDDGELIGRIQLSAAAPSTTTA